MTIVSTKCDKYVVALDSGCGGEKSKETLLHFSPTLEVKSLLPGSPVVDLS